MGSYSKESSSTIVTIVKTQVLFHFLTEYIGDIDIRCTGPITQWSQQPFISRSNSFAHIGAIFQCFTTTNDRHFTIDSLICGTCYVYIGGDEKGRPTKDLFYPCTLHYIAGRLFCAVEIKITSRVHYTFFRSITDN